MLKVRDVSFHSLLRNVSFDACSGEILVVIGPNGAGKSTLLNCISTSNKATSGKITFYDQDLEALKNSERAEKVAVLSQKISLAFDLMVHEVVELGLYPYYLSYVDRKKIIEDLLEQFNLVEYKHRLYSTLSGGEQQRVQMARVFAQLNLTSDGSTKLLLLDEHVSHLDPHFQHSSFLTIKKLAVKFKLIVIAVVHDLVLAAEYADKILLLNDGEIIASGQIDEVITNDNMLKCFNMSLIGDLHNGFRLSPSWQ